MESGKDVSATPSRADDSLLFGEKELLERMEAVIPACDNTKSGGLVVQASGRHQFELLECESWMMKVGDRQFPLHAGLQWRKNFRGKHAEKSGLRVTEVTILFEIVMSTYTTEKPLFKARCLQGGIMSPTFQFYCKHNLERIWLTQTTNEHQAIERCRRVRIDSQRFLGFENMHFAHYLRESTSEFTIFVERGGRGAYKSGEEKSERSERRV